MVHAEKFYWWRDVTIWDRPRLKIAGLLFGSTCIWVVQRGRARNFRLTLSEPVTGMSSQLFTFVLWDGHASFCP